MWHGDKKVVITSYGHDKTIDKISVSIFDDSNYNSEDNASTYCVMTNSLELKDDSWVYASIVPKNTPISLLSLLPDSFNKLIPLLDDRAVQKVLREVTNSDLVKALFNAKEEVSDKIYKNMSSRVVSMLKEDISFNGAVSHNDVYNAQISIVKVIKHLEDTGEIVVPKDKV